MDAPDQSERTLVRRPGAVAPAAPLAHVLLLRDEGATPRRIPLGHDAPLHIGRGPRNGLVLASPDVSRRHCTVDLRPDGTASVTDNGSTNGVYVDGVRIQDAASLAPGCRLVVGPYTLRYQRGTAEELAQAEAREQEQARAVAYIQALLPPPLRGGGGGPVCAEWRFAPSAQIGGDAFGYRWLGDGQCRRFALFLLDVSGHGVGSALLAASAANMLRAGSLAGVDPGDPAAVLSALNAVFPSDEQDGLFFTIWYGAYDPARRVLSFASAGHHPAYLAGPSGGPLLPLATRAPAIGMSPRARFRADEVPVPEASCLTLFSDGAFELSTPDGRAGAIGDVLALLAAPPAPGTPEPDRIFEALRDLNGRRPFEDDVSILSLRFP